MPTGNLSPIIPPCLPSATAGNIGRSPNSGSPLAQGRPRRLSNAIRPSSPDLGNRLSSCPE
eukprot:6114979-Pyramimonas_sp.AAC.1